jgi:hypothetical protein
MPGMPLSGRILAILILVSALAGCAGPEAAGEEAAAVGEGEGTPTVTATAAPTHTYTPTATRTPRPTPTPTPTETATATQTPVPPTVAPVEPSPEETPSGATGEPTPEGCVPPTIDLWAAERAPEGADHVWQLIYRVSGATDVRIFDNIMSDPTFGVFPLYGDENANWVLTASAFPECYVEQSIDVDVGALPPAGTYSAGAGMGSRLSGFTLALAEAHDCGGSDGYTFFLRVANTGSVTFTGGERVVVDLDTGATLNVNTDYSSFFLFHNSTLCGQRGAQELAPGESAFLLARTGSPAPTSYHGHNARASVTLCDLFHNACAEQSVDFTVPPGPQP